MAYQSRVRLRLVFCCAVTLGVAGPARAAAKETPVPALPERAAAPVQQLIPWLLDEDRQLRGIAFRDVIEQTTGKKVLPVEPENEVDQRVVRKLKDALDQVVRQMNEANSPIQKVERINEVSSHFEDMLRELLNASPGLTCEFPRTADGKLQRSGYPDLRIVDKVSHRVFYLDPKLYAAGSRDSTLRTFYFEPRTNTNKVRDDAVHFVAGFEHEPRNGGLWKFTRWDLVDLSKFKVNLKAEFQGSNRDLYRPEAVIATSGEKPSE